MTYHTRVLANLREAKRDREVLERRVEVKQGMVGAKEDERVENEG